MNILVYMFEADYALVFIFRIKVKLDFVFAPLGEI